MRLNLNDIIWKPGTKKPFEFSLDLPDPPSCKLHGPFLAKGQVLNIAGALELRGEVELCMTCTCDRCMREFEVTKPLSVTAYLAEELTDEENPDIFLIEDSSIDLEEIFTTAFLLDTENKIVCDEDCEGLCIACGANLNDEPCVCPKEVDPRLAALQQLLE